MTDYLITLGLHSLTLTMDPGEELRYRLQSGLRGRKGQGKSNGRGLPRGGAYLLDSCRLAGGSGSASVRPQNSSAPRTAARSRGTAARDRPGSRLLARLPQPAAPAAPSARPSLHPGPPPAEELRNLHIRSNRKCLVFFHLLSAEVHPGLNKSSRNFLGACPAPRRSVICI